MKWMMVGVTLAALFSAGCGQLEALFGKEEPPKPMGEVWKERAEQIEPGMKRAEVETLLPPAQGGPIKRSVQADSQILTYWLDNEWKVAIEYDFSGLPEDQDRRTEFDSPENQVLTPPVLERQYL